MNQTLDLTPREIATQIQGMYTEGRQPGFSEIDTRKWESALKVLVNSDDLAAARFGAALLLAAQPDNDRMRRLCRMIDVAPRVDPVTRLAQDVGEEIQVAARPGATTAVLVFGRSDPFGVAFTLTHRWLGRLDASIVYLRDFVGGGTFVSGIRTFGRTLDTTLAALRPRIAETGASRTVCIGYGTAGYAAALYACELGSDAAVSLAGPASLSAAASGQAAHRQRGPGLAELLASTPRPPRVLIVCGDENAEDRRQAERVAMLPSVTVRLMERHRAHDVTGELICRGQFDRVLEWMMQATPEDAPVMDPLPDFPWRDVFA